MSVIEEKASAEVMAGRDLEDWPTADTDQAIAIQILTRYSREHGFVWLPRPTEMISEKGGGEFEIALPTWISALECEYTKIYSASAAEQIIQKTLRWLHREIFQHRTMIRLHDPDEQTKK